GSASIVGDPNGGRKLMGSLRLRRHALTAARSHMLERHGKGEIDHELLIRLERGVDPAEIQLTASEKALDRARPATAPPRPLYSRPRRPDLFSVRTRGRCARRQFLRSWRPLEFPA